MVKKLILLGFGLVLLIGLPLAIFVLQNQSQTTTQSGAAPVTKFTFSGPVKADAGQNIDEAIVVNPGGTNQVSFVKFTFTYDPQFIDKQTTPFTVDTTKYTQLETPTITCTDTLCTGTGTISIGSNQSAVIKTATTIATVHLIAKADTDANGTQLAFVSGQNQALSVGNSDQAAENVFQSGVAATIVIGNQGGGGGGPTDTPTPTDANGTGGGDNGGGNNGGGTSGGGGGTSSSTVACTSFTADKTSGNSPLTVTFTTVGSSQDDSITQIAITYGDGTSDTVASGSGITTGDVNNQISHTYSSNGTFSANAVLTTASGATSDTSTCTQTITVGAVAQATAKPTGLPPTGPGDTFLLVGAAGAVATILGLITVLVL